MSRTYICDYCGTRHTQRDDIVVFAPSDHDAQRGAEQIDVCRYCLPDDMDISQST